MYNPDIHHRQSIRLRDFDYSAEGAYSVTICTHERECLFGEIRDGEMLLNDTGRVVESWWQDVSRHFMHVVLDEYMIMPNHFHGIVVINNVGAGSPRPDVSNGNCIVVINDVGAGFPRPMLADENRGGETPLNQGGETPLMQGGETPPLPKPNLGQVVGYFKYQTTKQINRMRDNPGVPVWQRNYYDRIIRDEEEMAALREYIAANPVRWAEDKENPDT